MIVIKQIPNLIVCPICKSKLIELQLGYPASSIFKILNGDNSIDGKYYNYCYYLVFSCFHTFYALFNSDRLVLNNTLKPILYCIFGLNQILTLESINYLKRCYSIRVQKDKGPPY